MDLLRKKKTRAFGSLARPLHSLSLLDALFVKKEAPSPSSADYFGEESDIPLELLILCMCNYLMEYEWEERKRQANIIKHGVDFPWRRHSPGTRPSISKMVGKITENREGWRLDSSAPMVRSDLFKKKPGLSDHQSEKSQ